MQSRAFRGVLALLFALWLFDKLVWNWTQWSFFASVGLESWFWRGFWAPLQLFGAFFAVCLGLIALILRPLAPRQSAFEDLEAPPLRGVLAGLSALRTRIYPVARTLSLVFALLLSLDFARFGQEWLALQRHGRVGFGYLGLDASVWTTFLPIWMPWLLHLWEFSLALGFLTLVTGVLRALPTLAASNLAPVALSRLLWRTGALILALRALIYVSQTLDLPRGRALESGDVWVLAPIWILGALWCALLSLVFLRRARRKVAPFPPRASDKIARPLILGLFALFLPALLGHLTLPLRAFWPETVWLKAQRERATRFAWDLPQAQNAARFPTDAAPVERNIPVWDEARVLATRARPVYRGERWVKWQSANLGLENGRWSALLAGQSASAESPTTSREVGKNSALALERIDLLGAQLPEKGAAIPVLDAYFGLEGPPLFAEKGGISLLSPALRWAWTWRTRDLFLPVDAATAPHLLAFRGARSRAHVLAPFLMPVGEPQLAIEGENPVWSLDLRAMTRHFPGAMRGVSGDFAGSNAVLAPVQMRLEARSGAVAFETVLDRKPAKSPRNFDASGAVLRAQAEVLAAMRGSETAIYGPSRGLNWRGETVWRVISAGKNEFELLESGGVLTRSSGDLAARLSAIDAAIGEVKTGETAPEAGEPAVWRDARAPGGFWVAHAFFGSSQAREELQNTPRGPVLRFVALTGIASESRVGIGASAREAQLDFAGQSLDSNPQLRAGSAAPLNSKPLSSAAGSGPEVEALRNHRALEGAVKSGDWTRFGALSKQQIALLESLIAAKKGPAAPTPP